MAPPKITLKYTIVDAFTSAVFGGNPASVIVLDEELPDATLQLIGCEFNLSETAFLVPTGPPGKFNLRWFTPLVEAPVCGHATLAAARVLFDDASGLVPKDIDFLEFETRRAGKLGARKLSDGRIELEFPASEVRPVNENDRKEASLVVQEALCISESAIKFIGRGIGQAFETYMVVEVHEKVNLAKTKVDTNPLTRLTNQPIIVVTSTSSNPKVDFISRVFAPIMGIPEDPVTGSAHCVLGPYWAMKRSIVEGTEMTAKQVSARVGDIGFVWDRERGLCRLRGHAEVVARGEIYVPV